jgi:ADP-glucose pyrophosphorylase
LPDGLDPSEQVRQSVIGHGVQLAEGVTLDRCVVWAHTKVRRSARNAVITPEHRIELSIPDDLP